MFPWNRNPGNPDEAAEQPLPDSDDDGGDGNGSGSSGSSSDGDHQQPPDEAEAAAAAAAAANAVRMAEKRTLILSLNSHKGYLTRILNSAQLTLQADPADYAKSVIRATPQAQ